MPAAAEELRDLARSLRARLKASEEDEWVFGSPPPKEPPPPFEGGAGGAVPKGTALEQLAHLAREVEACRRCPLGSQRLHPAFGVGSPTAEAMFVGEGPGFEEDRRGEPFVGKAGQLLDRILAAIGLSRQTVYIANVVKCHPMVDPSQPDKRGNDRPPSPSEIEACRGYLEEQVRLIRPRAIVALGAVAARALTGSTQGITALRGKWREFQGVPLLPTYHPAALLRNPELKREAWEDMKELKRFLENPK